MKKRVPKIGDYLSVQFLDHAENSKSGSLLFEAVGLLTKITKDDYTLHTWRYVKDVDRAGDEPMANENCFSIVRRAIKQVRILK
jgi:hypothetical protein